MRAKVSPSVISGKIHAPASKSAMQRACAAALIRKGRSVLLNAGNSDDDKAAIGIIGSLGAKVQNTGSELIIESNGVVPLSSSINCGESGLSLRMFTPVAAIREQTINIEGTGTLLKRPVDFFDEVLPQLNVECRTNNGLLPFSVKGPLTPRDITIDGSRSSQYLTGLLFAYSALAANATIQVKDLASKPYIDLSLQILSHFGLPVPENNQYQEFRFSAQNRRQEAVVVNYNVEGDWSGAAFLLVAGAIAGNITVQGLDLFSAQADKGILQVLQQSGAVMSVTEKEISIQKAPLKAFHFNAFDCPDLFPPLAALACYCQGTSVIEGVSRLKHKESDRASSIVEEFSSLGASIRIQDELMVIGERPLTPSRILHSHHDHRIAMALAVAGLGMKEPVVIDHADCVNKSYPAFFKHISLAGASVSLTHDQ